MTEDKSILYNYVLQLADNCMIIGQRNSEWCGHGPILEQDIAITNITLDLIGQARNLYQYSALLKGEGATEDTEAFLRDVLAYKNLLLVEQPNTDWAYTIVRQFLFDVYHFYTLDWLKNSKDEHLADIAKKSIKEVTYHLKWSSEWVIRLGDGTEESNNRMQNALAYFSDYISEMFEPSDIENKAAQLLIAPQLDKIKVLWKAKVDEVLQMAYLSLPNNENNQTGGKIGYHSEHLGYILAEMQFMQRAYPNMVW